MPQFLSHGFSNPPPDHSLFHSWLHPFLLPSFYYLQYASAHRRTSGTSFLLRV
jgi:hypothetical protein